MNPKFDGASISLLYENDQLVRATTRGDGVEGEEITTNSKQIKSIPLSASFSKYGIRQIEIRGEVILSKQSFTNYNTQLISRGLLPLANPRNAASGSLRMKDPKEVALRNLDAFLYHVSYYVKVGKKESSDPITNSPPNTHSGMHLEDKGDHPDLGIAEPEGVLQDRVDRGNQRLDRVVQQVRDADRRQDGGDRRSRPLHAHMRAGHRHQSANVFGVTRQQ